ncbi:MAG: PorP/SprF family type IX secretion system membrane protein [Flavobacteriales bacterium]|nr:PorP/SprF family type IX secretion system membrane protein [Flavobacteriales bacterium]
MNGRSTYNIIKASLVGLCLAMPFSLLAQQSPITNQFMTNHFVYSPAFAGAEGDWKGNISYRKEWVGISGAPITKFINVNGPVAGNGGFGASLISEDIGMIKSTNGSLSYAYHLEVGSDHTISFGVNGGFHENRINLSDMNVDDGSDDVFLNSMGGLNNSFVGTALDIGAGINYTYEDATVGVSVPNLLGNSTFYQNQNSNLNYTYARHYLMHASFEFGIKDDLLRFEPILIGRLSQNSPVQVEAAVLTKYDDWIWVGLGFRSGGIYHASGGAMISDKINILYSYEFGFAGITAQSSGSHEIGLGFNISGSGDGGGSKKDDALEDVKPLIDSLGALYAALEARVDYDSVRIDSLDARIFDLEHDVVDNKEVAVADIGRVKGEVNELDRAIHGSENLSVIDTETGEQQSLKQGYYVVIEAFRSFSNAKVGIMQWDKKGKTSFIVFNSEREWYYIYLSEYDSYEHAKKDRDAMRDAGYTDVWIHKFQ